MTSKEYLETIVSIDNNLLEIAKSKANDYASTKDTLSNFKTVSKAAEALGIDVSKPDQYALFMSMLKVSRICNLRNSGKVPNNESIADSFLDGINYFKLAYCCYLDEERQPKDL